MTKNLVYFLLLSALLHLVMLSAGAWLNKTISPGQVLVVSLLSPNSESRTVPATSPINSDNKNNRALKILMTTRMQMHIPATDGKSGSITEKDNVKNISDISDRLHNNKTNLSLSPLKVRSVDTGRNLQKTLQQELVQYFYYPPLAYKQGWEGEVILGLRIESSGRISHTQVTKSSGYGILDRAALTSARKIRALPEAAAWLAGTVFDLQVPVVYRLVDG